MAAAWRESFRLAEALGEHCAEGPARAALEELRGHLATLGPAAAEPAGQTKVQPGVDLGSDD
eukprot:14524275-Alexandrium_andersonii.AAC.1